MLSQDLSATKVSAEIEAAIKAAEEVPRKIE